MEYIVKPLGNGWYNFEALPQDHRYVKVCNLRCVSDRRARVIATRIVGPGHFIAIEKEK